ncbi:MAG: hypothetical protein Q7U54_00740 [Bacteroidales bacterium]|nr:hypothetical protein [Bacteroidales bacterium]
MRLKTATPETESRILKFNYLRLKTATPETDKCILIAVKNRNTRN